MRDSISWVCWTIAAAALAAGGCGAEAGRSPGGAPGLADDSDEVDEGVCDAPPGQTCDVPACADPCAYNDPELETEDCRIAEYDLECGDLRGVKILLQNPEATVSPPNAFFRGEDANLQSWVEQRWQELADFSLPAAVNTKIEDKGVELHNYPDGSDWTRTDFHGAIMALPVDERPETLLKRLLDDPLKTTGNNNFAGWVDWPASDDRKVADIVDLDIYGPDNGAIAYWKLDDDRFCVITVENDSVGRHPVNGIRCWGFVPIQVNPNWKLLDDRWNCGRATYLFYTMGIDSPSVPGGGTFGGVAMQRGTWNALMKDLSIENQKAGGVSGRWMLQKTVAQPNSLKPGGATAVEAPGELEGFYVGLPKDGFREGDVCEAPELTCGADKFTCGDASCIAAGRVCDGVSDCLDGDDEEACDGEGGESGCAANQWACADGACVPEDWRCDGEYEDCGNGEDEQGCEDVPPSEGCAAEEFTCSDGECIPGSWRCDGEYTDCSGGEDEQDCAGAEDEDPGGCSASEWACVDGACIPEGWRCDGEYTDCAGGEDEEGCGGGMGDDGGTSGGAGSCGAGEWACNDGACIPEDWQCDGEYTDCAGGEDEEGC